MVNNPSSRQNTKLNKKTTAGKKPFANYKTGEQLPLFELPPATANPVITKSLDKLENILRSLDIPRDAYNDLYEAAVAIIAFTASKERRAIELAQKESEAQNVKQ